MSGASDARTTIVCESMLKLPEWLATHTATSTPLDSIYIYKIGVLLVRNVLKRRDIKRLQELPILPQHVPDLFFAAILPNKRISEDEKQQEFYAVGHEEGTDAESVRRCLVRLVEKGAGNVADARAEPNHSRDNHLLGLAAGIRRYQRQRNDKRRLIRASQVTSRELVNGNNRFEKGKKVKARRSGKTLTSK